MRCNNPGTACIQVPSAGVGAQLAVSIGSGDGGLLYAFMKMAQKIPK